MSRWAIGGSLVNYFPSDTGYDLECFFFSNKNCKTFVETLHVKLSDRRRHRLQVLATRAALRQSEQSARLRGQNKHKIPNDQEPKKKRARHKKMNWIR